MNYEIVVDDNPLNPRTEYENLGTILYTSTRYLLGDKRVTAEEIEAIAHDNDMIVLPVYAYIHGGVSLSTSPFSDPWDSGQCGIIYVARKDAAKDYPDDDAIKAALRSEVGTFGAYLAGEVFGWVVKNDCGETIESCYGYYGEKDATQDAQQSLACHKAKQAERSEHTVMFGG